MTNPETCGAAGGAISMWVKVFDCESYGSIISTLRYLTCGASIYCDGNATVYGLFISLLEIIASKQDISLIYILV